MNDDAVLNLILLRGGRPPEDPAARRALLAHMVEAEAAFWTTPPARLGRYAVEGEAGRGGRSVVFRGSHDGQTFALKVLAHAHAFEPGEAARFRRQGEFGLMLDHPNLVKVHQIGWDETVPYLVLGWVEGLPLSKRLESAEGRRLEDLAGAFIQAARGMAHAHRCGVLHKDLKPDNLLVDRVGHVIVTDFGVAQRMGDAGEAGRIAGTPAYMSPEQARGETGRLDARADVFSLGASLYECLTLAQPYLGGSADQVLEAAENGRFPAPRKVNPDVPEALEAVVMQAMARAPSDRYPSMEALEADLASWLERGTVQARRRWF